MFSSVEYKNVEKVNIPDESAVHFLLRFTPDRKYLVVAQLNLSRLLVLAGPPVGSIGDCSVVSTIQLADQVLPHLLEVDQKTGAIYVAEIGAKQVQKFVPFSGYIAAFST